MPAVLTPAKPVDRREHRAFFELWAQVEFLRPRVLAWLPAADSCHVAFLAFEAAQDALPDDEEIPANLLHEAMRAYRLLSDNQRHGIMNGWTAGPEFPSLNDLERGVDAAQTALHCCTVEISNRGHSVFEDAIGGDSNHAPLTLHILHGTSKADALHALDQASRLVDRLWQEITTGGNVLSDGSGGYVTDGDVQKKSGRTAADSFGPGQSKSISTEATALEDAELTGNRPSNAITIQSQAATAAA